MQEENEIKCNLGKKTPKHANYKKNKNHKLFGAIIIERKLTLDKMAELLGVSGCYVHNLKEGRRNPSGKLAIKIKEHFDLPVEGWYC